LEEAPVDAPAVLEEAPVDPPAVFEEAPVDPPSVLEEASAEQSLEASDLHNANVTSSLIRLQIALFGYRSGECLQMREDGSCSALDVAGAQPADLASCLFQVVDAGDGKVAFHNEQFNQFIRISAVYVVDTAGAMNIGDLPPEDEWPSERFTLHFRTGLVASVYNAFRDCSVRVFDGEANGRGGSRGAGLPSTDDSDLIRIVPVSELASGGND